MIPVPCMRSDELTTQNHTWRFRAFLTKVDTGFVKKKRDNKEIEREFDTIRTCIALGAGAHLAADLGAVIANFAWTNLV